ncbi:hypothetical protein [Azonexus sp. IMCC34839]|uniref:hypothetical protein n=1 Tax=Azonexus sp. IMCC34839 TaxID=3133695 RepID=UPI003999A4CB
MRREIVVCVAEYLPIPHQQGEKLAFAHFDLFHPRQSALYSATALLPSGGGT